MCNLTPEQVQELTEKSWSQRAKGVPVPDKCIWCVWSNQQCYSRCPVPDVFGERCQRLRIYDDWCLTKDGSENERQAAQVILALLVKHQDELVQAAHEIAEGNDVDV